MLVLFMKWFGRFDGFEWFGGFEWFVWLFLWFLDGFSEGFGFPIIKVFLTMEQLSRDECETFGDPDLDRHVLLMIFGVFIGLFADLLFFISINSTEFDIDPIFISITSS